MSDGLANAVTVLSSVTEIITGNSILMTMFCGGLLVTGAYVFKKIKNAVRR